VKKYLIYTILIILGAIITAIIVVDISSNDINKTSTYTYDLEAFKRTDSSLVKYREIRRIELNFLKPKAIAYDQGLIGIAYEKNFQVIDTTGKEYFNKPMAEILTAISFSPEKKIYLGCKTHIQIFDLNGTLLEKWQIIDSAAYITSIAFKEDKVYLAEAAGQEVYLFNNKGEELNSFDGSARIKGTYGFIIPSPYFDLAIDPENQLWVANTGLQSVENFSDEGIHNTSWGESAFTIEGFIGCCNPAHFAIMSDGSFVTSEKGIIRIKVYNPSGKLESVVASSKDFIPDSEPVDLAIDENDRIYLLDISKKMIRKFERKEIENG
jgi:hypothetical protein